MNAPISPPSVSSQGLELRDRGFLQGRSRWSNYSLPNPRLPLPSPAPLPGDVRRARGRRGGEGSGRGGEKRLYSGKEGRGSCRPPAGDQEARGCPRRLRLLPGFPRAPRSPRGHRHWARRSWRCAPCAPCARAEETHAALVKCRAEGRVEVSPR